MAKVTGSYDSIVGGVSEQVPHERVPGQMWAQDNMVSDPVRGLARRHGSIMCHEFPLDSTYTDLKRLDLTRYKEHSFNIGSNAYSLSYRGADAAFPVSTNIPGAVIVNKDTRRVYDTVMDGADADAAAYLSAGLSTVAQVGNYVLMARKVPCSYSVTDTRETKRDYSVIWIKAGAYSRTFEWRLFDNTNTLLHTGSFTTLDSYYGGVLDTSGISYSDPDYQKQINDAVNDYTTATNQYIGFANFSIQPEVIATVIKNDIDAAALPGVAATVYQSYVAVYIPDGGYVEIDDGGDGSLVASASQIVRRLDELTPVHQFGKVIEVQPTGISESLNYYVQAETLTPIALGYWKVKWVEKAGEEVLPTFCFLYGYIDDATETFYVSSTPAFMAGLGQPEPPAFVKSASGDTTSQPIWKFLTDGIDYMTVFQDRLVIVSDASVFMSKTGDYFNFFRTSALTVTADDPFEKFARGPDDDVISSSIVMDQNLILFGKRNQYIISGRDPITPQNAFVSVQSAYADADGVPPVLVGQQIMFTQSRGNKTNLQQMQAGAYVDSYITSEVSARLDSYLDGAAQQLVAMTSPAQIFLRVKQLENGVFTYNFVDDSEEKRMQDSWSRWVWSSAGGALMSIYAHNGFLYTLSFRQNPDVAFPSALVLDEFSRESNLSNNPYLDSMRPMDVDVADQGTLAVTGPNVGEFSLAISRVVEGLVSDVTYQRGNMGTAAANHATFIAAYPDELADGVIMLGMNFNSFVEPTMPYRKDFRDRPILDGRMTITKFNLSMSDSSALLATVRDESAAYAGERVVTDWVYRPVGEWVLGTQPVAASFELTVPVMKEIRECRVRFESQFWLPMAISAIEYSGQFFSRRK